MKEKTYQINWIETAHWTATIKAKSEKEAEDKFFKGQAEPTAEIGDGEMCDGSLEIHEVEDD